MEELKIPGTKTTPEIQMNQNGIIKISGRSIHENIANFFKPAENWVSNYVENPADITCLDIKLEYFNSASAKMIIRLIQKIAAVRLKNRKFIVNWYYEEGDDDILERGEYFSSVAKIPFNYIKI